MDNLPREIHLIASTFIEALLFYNTKMKGEREIEKGREREKERETNFKVVVHTNHLPSQSWHKLLNIDTNVNLKSRLHVQKMNSAQTPKVVNKGSI